MKKTDTIVVLGNGLVGKNLINYLKINNYKDIIHPTSQNVNLINQEEVHSFFNRFKYGVKKLKYVFFTSAKVGGIKSNIEDPYSYLYNNLMIQSNVFNELKDFDCKTVFLGSSCIYPKQAEQPFKEKSLLTGSLEPTNENYALAKISGLKLAESLNKQYNKKVICLMPPNIYGEHDHFNNEKSHVLSALISRIHNAKKNKESEVVIWGSGKQRREFLYVQDLIDCMIWSVNNLEKTDTFLNCGSGEDVSILQLAKIISNEIGYKGNIICDSSKPDGMKQKLMDSSDINKLGWKSKTSLEVGIKKTIQWYGNCE